MITFDEPKLQYGPGHVRYYYVHFFQDGEMIPGIARGNTPKEAIENAEILKIKLEKLANETMPKSQKP